MGTARTPRNMAKAERAQRKTLAQLGSGGQRSRLVWIAAFAVTAAALLAATIIWLPARNGNHAATTSTGLDHSPATVAAGADSMPPWPAPTDAAAAVAAAGLPMLGEEGMVEHVHTHLDVLVNGRAVPVPARIGIDGTHRTISPLHTHDSTGVIHVESPAHRQFSLGEFFSEWQVSLSANNIGALRAADGKSLRVFVNGAPQTGNPAAILLKPHDEIAVVYGTPEHGESIPSTYNFPRDA
ncbi:MAG: hypothetical protein J0H22_16815 [Actinobacteria bacterium]|nr:hypothetical protein [Actinomycetota bacterium]